MKRIFFYTAMFFMVLELTYLNCRSLTYLIEDYDWVGKIFSVIGAITFSMFTILAMRTSNKKWMAIVFPVFDVFWVLYGLNLRVYDTLLANPVAFALRIQFGLFTGLVTYCLGTIDINRDKFSKDSNLELLKSKLTERDSEINELHSKLDVKQSEVDFSQRKITTLENEIINNKTDIENLKSELRTCEFEMRKYKGEFIKYEMGRIRKKKVENRTREEMQILEEAESNN